MKKKINIIIISAFMVSFVLFMDPEKILFAHGEKSHAVARDKTVSTYKRDIVPLFNEKCSKCHGANSPVHMEFVTDMDTYKKKMKGPRMDTFEYLCSFIVWPDTGSLMRAIDDGKHTGNSKPGRMYKHLGKTEEERQQNLKIFKDWVGYWTLKEWADIEKEEIDKMQLTYK